MTGRAENDKRTRRSWPSAAPWPEQEATLYVQTCHHSTNLPEPSGPFDDRFVYRLTPEGKKILAEHGGANGKPAFSEARCTPVIAETLDSETRQKRKRRTCTAVSM